MKRALLRAGLVSLCIGSGAWLSPEALAKDQPPISFEIASGDQWGAFCCTRERNDRCRRTSDRCCDRLFDQCSADCQNVAEKEGAKMGSICDRKCYDAWQTCKKYRGPAEAALPGGPAVPRAPGGQRVQETQPGDSSIGIQRPRAVQPVAPEPKQTDEGPLFEIQQKRKVEQPAERVD
jgi:hypothetical protein